MKRSRNVLTPLAAADTASGDARSQLADLGSSTHSMIDHHNQYGDQLDDSARLMVSQRQSRS